MNSLRLFIIVLLSTFSLRVSWWTTTTSRAHINFSLYKNFQIFAESKMNYQEDDSTKSSFTKDKKTTITNKKMQYPKTDSKDYSSKKSQYPKNDSKNYASKNGQYQRLDSKEHSSDRNSKTTDLTWRLFNIDVALVEDPGKDYFGIHEALLQSISTKLGLDIAETLQLNSTNSIRILRKSFDARSRTIKALGQPSFSYAIDIDLPIETSRRLKLRTSDGRIESRPMEAVGQQVIYKNNLEQPITELSSETIIENEEDKKEKKLSKSPSVSISSSRSFSDPKVVVVGSGPAGLFAALELAEKGFQPIIIERGQPVEQRGRDIGALVNRAQLDPDSNFCYGEGGAGTWSDGKLTTRIGKNSEDVRFVLETFVRHGAPPKILMDGKPHLGTDRLVLILRLMRQHLQSLGAQFLFGECVEKLLVTSATANTPKEISGVKLRSGLEIRAAAVILATGHSSRALYEALHAAEVEMSVKPFSSGFRIEHPQSLINDLQLGEYASQVESGKGKVPVADYRLATEVPMTTPGSIIKTLRPVYSFCMCPGGQIVPTSVDPNELCVNGMSFSKRQSKWANSALVVSVNPEDCYDTVSSLSSSYTSSNSSSSTDSSSIDLDPLVGIKWQQIMEREAAIRGGGKLVAPVQRVTDFLADRAPDSSVLPSSSYRLGVKASSCHEIYPPFITEALKTALLRFEREMPGYITPDALLHGVETRTSAPIKICRDPVSLQSTSLRGLYPTGEGAGHAGGIVSAAVDGRKVGIQVTELLKSLQSNIRAPAKLSLKDYLLKKKSL